MLHRLVPFGGSRRARARRARLESAVAASGLFDAEWYLRAYPDVAGFPDGPLAHFMTYGAAEGRAAGPRFDTKAYLAANPDVAALALNPLVHYLERGLQEGRTFAPAGETEGRPLPPPRGRDRFDIFDEAAMAAAAGPGIDFALEPLDTASLEVGLRSGTRIVLELLRRRDLRRRFPRALHEGADGPFARFAKSEGVTLLGLDVTHAPWIDAAFAAEPELRARHVLVFDDDLRRREPLFLMPGGALAACRTLFAAMRDGAVTREQIWWFLMKSAQDAQGALCETWALTPSWQEAVPDGGTVFGLLQLAQWVAETHGCHDPAIFAQSFPTLMSDADQVRLAYGARPEWRNLFPGAMADEAAARALLAYLAGPARLPALARAWLAERAGEDLVRALVQPGLTILGHFAYPSGLRTSVENIVEGLDRQRLALSLRDVPVTRVTDEPTGWRFQGAEIHDTTLIHLQPDPYFLTAYTRAGLQPRAERTYRIGYWYWEFDSVPEAWNEAALHCDEFWTATEFVAAGLRERYRQPVRVLPPGVEIDPFPRLPRSAFGLGDGEFLFAFVFHMTSVMERKNPIGLIDAFVRAFPNGEPARLVIKTCFGERHPDELARLKAAAAGAKVTIIDRITSQAETLGLIGAADAYVSLHRSEGLGLTMAEAMLLGRPVIATRYSGNLDFMDDGNSLLVDCDLVTLDRDIPPYEAGLRWAEPDVAQAASLMRRLFDDPAAARDLGLRAKADLETRFSYDVTGKAIAQRLREIAAERAATASG